MTTNQTFIVRAGSDGEALVTAPSGRMQFMGPWTFLRFVIATTWQSCKERTSVKFEVQDD